MRLFHGMPSAGHCRICAFLTDFLSLDPSQVAVQLSPAPRTGQALPLHTTPLSAPWYPRAIPGAPVPSAEGLICVLGAAVRVFINPSPFTRRGRVGKITMLLKLAKTIIPLPSCAVSTEIFAFGAYCSLQKALKTPFRRPYANPAQILPLVQSVYDTGDKITADTVAEAALCASLAYAQGENAPIIGFPCAGDRRFAGTQHHELLFALPAKQLPHLIENLKIKRQTNPRLYPVAPSMQWVPTMPSAYTLCDDDLVD